MKPLTLTHTARLTDVEVEGHGLHARLVEEARLALSDAIEGGDLAEVMRATV